jgi:hypothetical protein
MKTILPALIGVSILGLAGCHGSENSSSKAPPALQASFQDIMLTQIDASADKIWGSTWRDVAAEAAIGYDRRGGSEPGPLDADHDRDGLFSNSPPMNRTSLRQSRRETAQLPSI